MINLQSHRPTQPRSGGYYIHGKEKLVEMDDEPARLRGFKDG